MRVAHGQQQVLRPSPACAPWPRAGSTSPRTSGPAPRRAGSSVDSTQRFQRGFISLAPAEVRARRSGSSPRRTARRATARPTRSRCQCRYVFQSASGTARAAAGRPPAGTSAPHVEVHPRGRSRRAVEVGRPVEARRQLLQRPRTSSCGRWPSDRAGATLSSEASASAFSSAKTVSRRGLGSRPRRCSRPGGTCAATCARYFSRASSKRGSGFR